MDLVDARRPGAVIALLVEDEAGVHDAGLAVQRGHDLFGAAHLRHELWIDEAGGFHLLKAGVREPITKRSANRRLERARLVLKPVARADIADRNAAHIDKGRATELGNGSSGFVYRRAKFRRGNARLYTNDGLAGALGGPAD